MNVELVGGPGPSTCEWEEYVGTFEGTIKETKYKVEITETTVTVTIADGEPTLAEISDYSYSEGFTILLGEDEYYLYFMSGSGNVDLLMFASGDYQVNGSLSRVKEGGPEPTTPVTGDWTAFVGTFEGEIKGTNYKVEITATEITVTIGEDEPITAEITYYDEEIGEFELTLNGTEYALSSSTGTEQVDAIGFGTADFSTYGQLNRVGTSEGGPEPTPSVDPSAWAEYTGTYKGTHSATNTEYTVEVGETITVKVGEEGPYEATVTEQDLKSFYITFNGENWSIEFGYGDGTGAMLANESYTTRVTLSLEAAADPELAQYAGTFSGSASDGTKYVVTIDGNSITISANGDEQAATEVSFLSRSEGFEFTYNGEAYTLIPMDYDGDVQKMMLANEDYSVTATLTRGAADEEEEEESTVFVFTGEVECTTDSGESVTLVWLQIDAVDSMNTIKYKLKGDDTEYAASASRPDDGYDLQWIAKFYLDKEEGGSPFPTAPCIVISIAEGNITLTVADANDPDNIFGTLTKAQ